MNNSDNIQPMRDGRELIQKADDLLAEADGLLDEVNCFVPPSYYQKISQQLDNEISFVREAHQWHLDQPSSTSQNPFSLRKYSPNEIRSRIDAIKNLREKVQAELKRYKEELADT